MTEQENDLKMLQKLFKKVQSQHKIDKVKLLKQLLDSNGVKSKNILTGIVGGGKDQTSRQEE